MTRRNIYQGCRSCYALNEGMYVRGSGVNLHTGIGILYLLLRDLKRGWTYDHECRRIPMTEDLFKRRARYLYALCVKHTGGARGCEILKDVIEYVIEHKQLPPWAERVAKYMIAYVKPTVKRPVAKRPALAVARAR